jgi:endonuclease G
VRLLAALVVAALTASSQTAAAADKCTAEQARRADKWLWLNKRDRKLALARHLPWGVPEPTIPVDNEKLLVHWDYVINYDLDLLVPVWTAHRLELKGLGRVERVDCFRQDPRTDSPRASLPRDYLEPIFDQGHLVPNGDMSRSLTSVLNSFVMTNMTPQYCQFNRGVWQILESLVRSWVKQRRTLYIVTGSVFDRDGDGERDSDDSAYRMKSNDGRARVARPTHFYKILLHLRGDGTLESLALLLRNDQTDLEGKDALAYLESGISSIDEIESVTGLNFFPQLSEAAAAKLKRGRAPALWLLEAHAIPTSLVNAACRKTSGAFEP